MKIKKSWLVGSIICTLLGTGVQPIINRAFAQTTPTKTQLENQLSPQLDSKSEIKLISAGAEPRQKLRFTPQKGQKETAQMNMDMDMSMSVNGKRAPSFNMPGTNMKFDTIVNNVEPNGDINYNFSYTDVDLVGQSDLPPSALEQIRSELKKMQGLRGNAIVDNTGRTKKANFVIPSGLDPALKQMMEQMAESLEQISAQVPLEAIGKGGKWEVTSTVKFNGINLQQTAIYELINVKGGVATMNISLVQKTPGVQRIVSPQMPKGAKVMLQSYNATGTGQATISLNKIMPLSSSIKTNTNAKMLVTVPNSPQQTMLDQQISMEMNIKSN